MFNTINQCMRFFARRPFGIINDIRSQIFLYADDAAILEPIIDYQNSILKINDDLETLNACCDAKNQHPKEHVIKNLSTAVLLIPSKN